MEIIDKRFENKTDWNYGDVVCFWDDDEQLFITPIRYEIICCHYTDGARNGV